MGERSACPGGAATATHGAARSGGTAARGTSRAAVTRQRGGGRSPRPRRFRGTDGAGGTARADAPADSATARGARAAAPRPGESGDRPEARPRGGSGAASPRRTLQTPWCREPRRSRDHRARAGGVEQRRIRSVRLAGRDGQPEAGAPPAWIMRPLSPAWRAAPARVAAGGSGPPRNRPPRRSRASAGPAFTRSAARSR